MANYSSLSPLWFCHHLAGEDRNDCVALAVPLSVFLCFFLAVPWVGLCYVPVALSGHILLFSFCMFNLFFSMINN